MAADKQTWVIFMKICKNVSYRKSEFLSFLQQGDSPFGKLDAYIKLEQLGEGSYATVFKGYSK